jgi:hypothetical protein
VAFIRFTNVCYKSFTQNANLRLDVDISSPSDLYLYLMRVVGTPGWRHAATLEFLSLLYMIVVRNGDAPTLSYLPPS